MNRKPYSIYRRRDWAPIVWFIVAITIAAVAVAFTLLAWSGVRFK